MDSISDPDRPESSAADVVGTAAADLRFDQIRQFSHPNVRLTEVVDGERLMRVLAYYDDVGSVASVSSSSSSEVARKRPMAANRPGSDLRTRLYPANGVLFEKAPDGIEWSRTRDYAMSKTQGDHRFQAPVKQIEGSLRDYLTARVSGHFDLENCNFRLFALILEHLLNDCDPQFSRVFEYAEHRERFFDALDAWRGHVDPPMPWKELFLAMLHQASYRKWLTEHGVPASLLATVPSILVELNEQLAEARRVVVGSAFGQQFVPYGWGPRSAHAGDVYGLTGRVLTKLLTTVESHQMLLIKRVIEEAGYRVTMWINDAFEVAGQGQSPDAAEAFLADITPRFGAAGVSPWLRLVFKSKEASEQLWEDRLGDWQSDKEQRRDEAMAAAENETSSVKSEAAALRVMRQYEELKEYAERVDHLAYCKKEERYVVLNRDEGEFPFPTLVSRETLKARYEHYPKVQDRLTGKHVSFIQVCKVEWLNW